MKKKPKTKGGERITILTRTAYVPLVNRSKTAGAKFLHYKLGRHDGKIYVKITKIDYMRGSNGRAGEAKSIGTYIKSWIPLDVLFGALVAWHERPAALPATFMLPTPKTRDFHDDPGVIRRNSTLPGHLVAIFRGERLLRAQPGPGTLLGGEGVRNRAGYRSIAGSVNPAHYFTDLRARKGLRSEPFDPERDIYKALRPPVEEADGV